MRVLVACEFSGVVRDAFASRGHDAWSCDLLPTEVGSLFHVSGDVFELLCERWDLVVAHPPCTAVCVSGNGTYAGTRARAEGVAFVRRFFEAQRAHGFRMALENPVGVLSRAIRPPDQYIQPWQHGHPETKKTGLWLEDLPPLEPTNVVAGREQRVWKMGPSPTRSQDRARTYPGIARAMAEQWGG